MAYSTTVATLQPWEQFPVGAIFSDTNQIDFYELEKPELGAATRHSYQNSSKSNVYFFNGSDGLVRTTITSLPITDFDLDVEIRLTTFRIDKTLSFIRLFSELLDGWDGPDSFAAKPDVVDDAIVVLQNWPSKIGIPEPSLGCDGNLVLELFDCQGLSKGGVEMIGGHRAVFTGISGLEVLCSGSFDTQTTSNILHALATLEAALVC